MPEDREEFWNRLAGELRTIPKWDIAANYAIALGLKELADAIRERKIEPFDLTGEKRDA